MLKLLGVGIWSVLVTLATFFALDQMHIFDQQVVEVENKPKIETATTNMMRVPIMTAEKPAGFALLDLSIDYDATILGAAAPKFQSIAIDEAFRAVYDSVGIDYKSAKKTDLTGLLREIGERLNKRLGEGVVTEIRVKEFMFVPPRTAG
jgi:hypothetical protein